MLPRLNPLLQPRTLTQKVHAILRKYGAGVNVYLPGIGSVSGIDAGNWLESTGITRATVDNPVGLALDTNGSIGPEVAIDPGFDDSGAWLVSGSPLPVVSGGTASFNQPNNTYAYVRQSGTFPALTVGKTYKIEIECVAYTSGTFQIVLSGGTIAIPMQNINSAGKYTRYFVATQPNTSFEISRDGLSSTYVATFDNVSIKEASGIHARQSTTANKLILRNLSNRYYWDFVDATDVLNATFPAGYESVTTIDAAPGGQVTLTAQNIVGTYAITTDTYGRFIFKTITADELVIMQKFANRLVGL